MKMSKKNLNYLVSTLLIYLGQYNDPNHPGCLRKVELKSDSLLITGS